MGKTYRAKTKAKSKGEAMEKIRSKIEFIGVTSIPIPSMKKVFDKMDEAFDELGEFFDFLK